MIDKFRSYFARLEGLSCEALDRSAGKIVQREKQNVAKLIAHLAEMSRRKSALELGYKNLFDYCLRRLHLSEGSIALRMQVASAARQFPQLLVALSENRLSLTVAGLLAPHVHETNVDKLLADCEGMAKREAEEYLVKLRPKAVFAPSIRRQPSPTSRATAAPRSSPAALPTKAEIVTAPPTVRPSPTIVEPAQPETFNFRFAADRSFKEKFERLAEVLGVDNAQRQMAEILERAIDIALEKKDPKKRAERRKQREGGQDALRTKSRPDEISKTQPNVTPALSRHVPAAVRDRVFARASHQCEYRSRAGKRCPARTGLQIEHERPFALYRSHDERYLRAFCAAHNRLAAERVYGSELIQRKILESKQRRRESLPRAP